MSRILARPRVQRWFARSTVVLLAVAATTTGPPAAAAQPVSVTATYVCPFPLAGDQTVTVTYDADLADQTTSTTPLGPDALRASAAFSETTERLFTLIGAASVRGSASARLTRERSIGTVAASDWQGTAPTTAVPASGSFVVVFDGPVSPGPVTADGTVRTRVSALTLTITPLRSDGSDTGLGTFTSACTPSGTADPLLGTTRVVSSGYPVAENDAYATPRAADRGLVVPAPGVLGNDTDSDTSNGPLTAVLDFAPRHGTLTLRANGSFGYVPDAGFVGVDTFGYGAEDGPRTTYAQVTITVPDQAPVASPDAYTTPYGETLSATDPGVLGNDADADGQALTSVLSRGVTHGSLTLRSAGGFTYVPDTGFSGLDTFTYTAAAGSGRSTPTMVSITVEPRPNTAPTTQPDDYSATVDVPLRVAAPGVLGNDTDAEGDPLAAALERGPTRGTVELAADGSFVYTPRGPTPGSDSFTYRASDPSGAASEPTTVTVSVGHPRANLSVVASAPERIARGGQADVTVTVTNAGPSLSGTTGLIVAFDPSLRAVGAPDGTVIEDGSAAAYVIGALAPGASQTLTLTVAAGTVKGRAALTATVSSVVPDLRHADNVTRRVVRVF